MNDPIFFSCLSVTTTPLLHWKILSHPQPCTSHHPFLIFIKIGEFSEINRVGTQYSELQKGKSPSLNENK